MLWELNFVLKEEHIVILVLEGILREEWTISGMQLPCLPRKQIGMGPTRSTDMQLMFL